MRDGEFLTHFERVRTIGPGEAMAACPVHPDAENSLSLKCTPDRRLLHCFAGCDTKEILAARGLSMADLFTDNGDRRARRPALTLEAFAKAKALPVDFLREHGLREDDRGIVIEYRLEDGTLASRQRRRTALAAKQGSSWDGPKGEPLVPYGLWRLQDARNSAADHLLLVEGESDALTAWLHGVDALGLPGADQAKLLTAEMLADIPTVYLIQEPDTGGETFVRGTALRLAELRWPGRAFSVRLPVKDLNDLHRADPEGFLVTLTSALDGRVPMRVDAPVNPAGPLGAMGRDEAGPVLPSPTAPDPWRRYDAAGADAWDVPTVEWTVEGLLPRRGVVWVGGPPKQGKSLLMLYLALAVGRGRPEAANHFPVLAQPKVLYVSAEDGAPRIRERMAEILAAWGGERPPSGAVEFLIREPINLLDPADVAKLTALCQSEGFTLVVLDTWTRLSPTADPMAAKDQAHLAAIVVKLAHDIDGAVVVVDHSRKNRPEGQPLSSADIFGPLQKWAAAEHVIMLAATGTKSRIEAFVEGKDSDDSRFFLDISPRASDAEKFTYAGTIAEVAERSRALGNANREAVFAVVAGAAGRSLSPADVMRELAAARVKMSLDTAKKHLRALAEAGRLSKAGDGRATKYFVAPESRKGPSYAIDPPMQETLYVDAR
jgi:hypothetical protein